MVHVWSGKKGNKILRSAWPVDVIEKRVSCWVMHTLPNCSSEGMGLPMGMEGQFARHSSKCLVYTPDQMRYTTCDVIVFSFCLEEIVRENYM
jgi:hypothetical protein